jgi:D-glycero-D-manno-heptose 1,7-bisphosphate phosphatase
VPNSANKFPPHPLHTLFLDRDGVLNRKMPEGHYVTSVGDFQPLPGVPEAIARLNRAGLRVIVVTNQRGVALGLYTSDDVRRIHADFQRLLALHAAHIDAFYVCPHDKHQCECRKPLTGLFDQARADFPEIDAATSLMIGDSLSDIEFGHRLGMTTVFIEGDPAHQKPGAESARQMADARYSSLLEATEALLDQPA